MKTARQHNAAQTGESTFTPAAKPISHGGTDAVSAVRHAVVTLTSPPSVLVYDAGGKLVDERRCRTIHEAAAALVHAREGDSIAALDGQYIGLRLTDAESAAVRWAMSRGQLRHQDFFRQATLDLVRRIVQGEISRHQPIPQNVKEVIALK